MFDHAQKLFDQMPKLKCGRAVLSLNALLAACIDSKKFDKIDEIFRLMRNYNTAFYGYFQKGALVPAFSLLEEMEKNGIEANIVTFNTLLAFFCGNGWLLVANKVWQMMASKNISPHDRS